MSFATGRSRSAPAASRSSSEEELEAHLGVARYGDFRLTDAIRPSYDLQVVPRQGYRHDFYRDERNHSQVPVLMGAVSNESLFEVFMDLLDPLGSRGRRGAGDKPQPRPPRPHRPLPRAHRLPGAQEHPLGIRGPAGERRLHGHCRA